jgi:23S rRNA pseudouridine1911/1915/1917 synthase
MRGDRAADYGKWVDFALRNLWPLGGARMTRRQTAVDIVYEDNHLLIAVKPANVLSQEDATGDPDMLSILKTMLKEKYNKPGNVFLGLVHRLDRPVGGVMAFAKTSKAASRISEAIRTGSFDKLYLAVVRGQPARSSAKLVDWLLKDERTNTVRVVAPGTTDAKQAILEYEALGTLGDKPSDSRSAFGPLSLLRVHLLTGRPHQIRVQLAHQGTPLFGDHRYGTKQDQAADGDRQVALWSHRLSFPHPITKETVSFNVLPPLTHPWNLWNQFATLPSK